MSVDPEERRAADLLRRAAERGRPRGIDALCAAAEGRVTVERERRRRRDLVLVAALVTVVAWATGFVALPGDRAGSGPDDLATGAVVYAERCAGCHGIAGEGAGGPALAGGASARAFPDVDGEVVFVRGPHAEAAGTVIGDLSDDEVAAVVRYVRELPV